MSRNFGFQIPSGGQMFVNVFYFLCFYLLQSINVINISLIKKKKKLNALKLNSLLLYT